jgi:hypothetical protein
VENIKFAWLPVRVTSGKRIWLKKYIQHRQLFDTSTGRPPIFRLYFTWTETPQEKTWRLLKESVVHNRNIWNDPKLIKEDNI